MNVIALKEKLNQLDQTWTPKIVAMLNDYEFKVAKLKGDFVWHQHDETDEAFLVLEGTMSIEFEGSSVQLKEGDLFIVPKGVPHKPHSETGCSVLLIEPSGIVNTGKAGGELTAPIGEWI